MVHGKPSETRPDESALTKRRRAGRTTAKSNSTPTDERQSSDAHWRKKIEGHRGRQASVSAILNEVFGSLAQCGTDVWERRAYLMLVGVVYERLATNEAEIPTEELIALAKVLAENRRAEHRARDSAPERSETESQAQRGAALPDAFSDVVRQIYGLEPPRKS